jgi:hypothetical protein
MINVAETTHGRLLSSAGDGHVWMIKSDGQREAFSDLHDGGWLDTCGGLILFTSFEAKTVTLTRVNEDGSHLLKLFSGDLSYVGCPPDWQVCLLRQPASSAKGLENFDRRRSASGNRPRHGRGHYRRAGRFS